jgi:ribose 5-phosphate isomerase
VFNNNLFAKEFVVVADHRKNSRQLGQQWQYVPVEVVPMAWSQVTVFIIITVKLHFLSLLKIKR